MNLTTWRKKYNIPTNKLLAKKCLEYRDARDWYANSRAAIDKLLTERYQYPVYMQRKLFIDILAATSPRQSVKRNLKCTLDIYIELIMGDGNYKKISCGIATKQIHKNIERAIISTKELHGQKVRAFAEALNGNKEAVVIDSWVLKAFGIPRQTPTPNDVVHITTIIKKLSDKVGLAPCEVQACLWSYAKTELNDTPFKEDNDFSHYIKELI